MSEFRSYGQAADPTERAVEQLLLRLADRGFSPPLMRYKRINLGITNFNWIIEAGAGKLFAKLYGDGSQSLIDRELTREASRIVGELRVGPRQVAWFDDVGAEVYEFLDQFVPCDLETFLRPEVRRNVLQGLRAVHDGPRLPVTYTGFDQLHERVERSRQMPVHLPKDIDTMLWQCRRAEAVIMTSGLDLVFSHNDLYGANIMVNARGDAKIIDWEYASNNDRAWDLANLSMSIVTEDVKGFLHDYSDAEDAALAARIVIYRVVILVSWGIWAAMQARDCAISYDYRSHSLRLLQMARYKLRQPEWEAALSAV